jgi:hypothetical protein
MVWSWMISENSQYEDTPLKPPAYWSKGYNKIDRVPLRSHETLNLVENISASFLVQKQG